MLCIRGICYDPVSVRPSVRLSVTSRCSTKTRSLGDSLASCFALEIAPFLDFVVKIRRWVWRQGLVAVVGGVRGVSDVVGMASQCCD